MKRIIVALCLLLCCLGAAHAQTGSPLPSGFLNVSGNQFKDGVGNNVRMACVNADNSLPADVANMRAAGFNCLRYSYWDAKLPAAASTPGSQAAMDAIVTAATAANMRVVFVHRGNEGSATDGCLKQQKNGLWYDLNGAAPYTSTNNTNGCGTAGTVSYATFRANWIGIASHYAGNPTVIGFDLHHEPLVAGGVAWAPAGICTNCGADISGMCSDVGTGINAVNGGALIICEGPLNNGTKLLNGSPLNAVAGTGFTVSDLSMAGASPVSGFPIAKLVYAAHDYPCNVGQSCASAGSANIAMKNAAWGYLETAATAPVFLGEIGCSCDGTNGNLTDDTNWATAVTQYANGQIQTQGGSGGPVFTGIQQQMSAVWWDWGNQPASNPNGALLSNTTFNQGQRDYWATLLYAPRGGGSGGGGGGGGTTPRRAADFMATLSVQGGISGGGAPYLIAAQQVSDLQYLGISHYRDGLNITMSGASLTALQALINAGISMDAQVPYGTIAPATQISQMQAWQALGTGAVNSIEGINEPELATITYNGNTGGGGGTWLPVAQYMIDYITAINGTPSLAGIPIFGVSRVGAETNNVGLQYTQVPTPLPSGVLIPAGSVVAGNFTQHVYPMDQNFLQGGIAAACQTADPAAGNAFNIDLHWNAVQTFHAGFSGYATDQIAQALPRVITEFGYATAGPAPSPGGDRVNADKAGRCITTGLLNATQQSYKYLSLYTLYDLAGTGFGLFSGSGTPATQGTYIHNLTTILQDTATNGRTFTPTPLAYTLSGMPATGGSILFQKANGHFQLALWDNNTNWNTAAGTPITIGPTTVTFALNGGSTTTLTRYDTTVGTAAQATVTGNSITVPLTDGVAILDIAPISGGAPTVATVWNPTDKSGSIALTGNNTIATTTASVSASVRSTTSKSSGKACFEAVATTISLDWDLGLANATFDVNNPNGVGSDTNGIGFDPNFNGGVPGQGIFFISLLSSANPVPNDVNGDPMTICEDFDAHLFWATSPVMRGAGNTWNNSPTADPATGTGGLSTSGLNCPCFITYNNFQAGVATLNTAGPFAVATPAGFSAWDVPANPISRVLLFNLGAIEPPRNTQLAQEIR